MSRNCLNPKELVWDGSDLGNITQFLVNSTSSASKSEIRTGPKDTVKIHIDIGDNSRMGIDNFGVKRIGNSNETISLALAIDELKPYFHLIPIGYHTCIILNNKCLIYQEGVGTLDEIAKGDVIPASLKVSPPTFVEEVRRNLCFIWLFCGENMSERNVLIREINDSGILIPMTTIPTVLTTSDRSVTPLALTSSTSLMLKWGIRTVGPDDNSPFNSETFRSLFDIKTKNEILNKIETTFRKYDQSKGYKHLMSEISMRLESVISSASTR